MKRVRLEENVQLLESKLKQSEVLLEAYQTRIEEFKDFQAFKDLSQDPRGRNVLGAIYSKAATNKAEIVKQVDKIKETSIYNGILDILLTDSLAPSVNTKDVVKLTSKNPAINDALKELQEERVDIDSFVVDMGEDFIGYGDYIVGIKGEEGKDKGVMEVIDNIEQGDVMAVYSGTESAGFLVREKRKYVVKPATDYLHFCLGRRKLRIKLDGSIMGTLEGVRPEYIRVGRPLFHGNYNEVSNLTLLSSLVPASYLHKINSTSLIGITIGGNTDPQEAFKICRKYDSILNKIQSFDSSTGTMTVADVLNAAGKFKTVPIFSDDQRGTLAKMDPRFEEMTDITMIQELKKDICGSIGVPYSFLYGGDIAKGEVLKQFARYVRKLLGIQMTVSTALIRLARIHCYLKGLKPAPDAIQVSFTNALISVDELDKIEFLDTLSSTLGTVVNSLTGISTALQAPLDGKKLGTFLNRFLTIMDLNDVFDFNAKKIEPLPPEGVVPSEEQ